MKKGSIHIGTSGWHYEGWSGIFYPVEMKERDYLSFYSTVFRTVEINSSFYHLPLKSTFARWKDAVPGDFIFAVKASRYITHQKKLKDSERPLSRFLENAEGLGNKLGIILFQLPPGWNFNPERLKEFIENLPAKHRYAFEFRDRSWINERTLKLLESHRIAFCIYDMSGYTTPKEVTSDQVYIRFHGSEGPYQGSYSDHTLQEWAIDILKWSGKGIEVYCYFNNDRAGYAVKNTKRLMEIIGNEEN
jgi:uncharacterized protein YecE (DUF72 family)